MESSVEPLSRHCHGKSWDGALMPTGRKDAWLFHSLLSHWLHWRKKERHNNPETSLNYVFEHPYCYVILKSGRKPGLSISTTEEETDANHLAVSHTFAFAEQ